MIIRICTEDKNPERLRELCQKHFDAFTMYRGMGAWKGISEPSVTIEIALLHDNGNSANNLKKQVLQVAKTIKEMNAQDAILVEIIRSENILL